MRMGKLRSSQPWVFVCVRVPITLNKAKLNYVGIYYVKSLVESGVVNSVSTCIDA